MKPLRWICELRQRLAMKRRRIWFHAASGGPREWCEYWRVLCGGATLTGAVARWPVDCGMATVVIDGVGSAAIINTQPAQQISQIVLVLLSEAGPGSPDARCWQMTPSGCASGSAAPRAAPKLAIRLANTTA